MVINYWVNLSSFTLLTIIFHWAWFSLKASFFYLLVLFFCCLFVLNKHYDWNTNDKDPWSPLSFLVLWVFEKKADLWLLVWINSTFLMWTFSTPGFLFHSWLSYFMSWVPCYTTISALLAVEFKSRFFTLKHCGYIPWLFSFHFCVILLIAKRY